MNRSLIDTDILSYYFRGDEEVKRNLRDYLNFFDKIETSIITHYEIVGGLLAKDAKKQLKIYEIFISQNSIMPLTEKSVSISAELYGKLKQTGNVIENEMTLVTNNESHFARLSEISDLKIENWKKK